MGAVAIPWGKIVAAFLMAAVGAFLAHKVDTLYYTAKLSHVETQLAQEKQGRADDVRKALVWATQKQQEYDDAALQASRRYTAADRDRAASYEKRLSELRATRVLVRGCITYEFVRQLDAAIVAHGPAGALSLPAGKSSGACAPVDAVAVVRWLLGIVEIAKQNGAQLDGLIGFIRAAQAAR